MVPLFMQQAVRVCVLIHGYIVNVLIITVINCNIIINIIFELTYIVNWACTIYIR